MSSQTLQLAPAALLIAAGTLTPGPNNFVVMRTAAQRGFAAATPTIVAIALGSVMLLALASSGAGAALAKWPLLQHAIAIGGCLYLLWLGVVLMRAPPATTELATHDSALGWFAFQLLNPKAWAMTLTLVATQAPAPPWEIFRQLAPLYAGMAALALASWALLGGVLRHLDLRPSHRRWIDRALGASLALGAALLLF